MKFDELHAMIPYAVGGKEKVLTFSPYAGVTLALPGRHALQTNPPGGDFVVMVTDKRVRWKAHQFKHDDIFADVESKATSEHVGFFMSQYLDVICGADPDKIALGDGQTMPGIDFNLFLHAVQCLAVAEMRRYAHYESKFGGRYLPFRFAAGIADGLWTAGEASEKQKYGRPAVERLERERGVPALTAELMSR